MAYGDLAWHIDLIALYDYVDGNVENIEILVVETWRVASTKRSSTTRNYIGAMTSISDLRTEHGAFATINDFYEFWRSYPVKKTEAVPEPEEVEPEEVLEASV